MHVNRDHTGVQCTSVVHISAILFIAAIELTQDLLLKPTKWPTWLLETSEFLAYHYLVRAHVSVCMLIFVLNIPVILKKVCGSCHKKWQKVNDHRPQDSIFFNVPECKDLSRSRFKVFQKCTITFDEVVVETCVSDCHRQSDLCMV